MNLERRVLRAIRQHGLAEPGDRLAVALSGGPDSVALTWLLHALAAEGAFTLAGLVHVNHGLRGEEAEADEAFCRALAARLTLPIEVARIDVAALARARRRSIEVAARDARYGWFAEAATRLSATRVATGHTLDDQAETVLLRLLRGAGSRGLTGIRVQRGVFVRPLLGCRRADLVAYLAARHEPFREDASNLDRAIARNRIRHDLLPVIDRLAPGGRLALARVAALAADDEDYFRQAVTELASTVVLPDGGLCLDALARRPPALVRRVLRGAVEAVAPGIALSASHLDAVWRLAMASSPSGALDLPGVVVERRGGTLSVRAVPAAGRVAGRPASLQFAYPLPCPGAAIVPEAGVTVLASTAESSAEVWTGRDDRAAVRRAAFVAPFSVRNRRDGDRFRPLGAPGRRKLQDVLVDRKIPREERDRVPIVTDALGRIVWVAGIAIAEEGRVTAPSEGVVILTVKKGFQ